MDIIERSVPVFTPQRKRPNNPLRTPINHRQSNALATPPLSQQPAWSAKFDYKRRRLSPQTPSLTQVLCKRSRSVENEDNASLKSGGTPPQHSFETNQEHGTATHARDESTSSVPHLPEATSAANTTTSPQPTPVIRRDMIVREDGHVYHDPSIFSAKPFKWDEWSPKDYLALATVLENNFDATGFAMDLSNIEGHRIVTTEEANWMLRAVVTRPLRLAECAKQRGENGMQELQEYVEKHGTVIRSWGVGEARVKGEFLGLDDYGVVIALATTKFGQAEQDAATILNEGLTIEMSSGRANVGLKKLSPKDMKYLRETVSDNDRVVLGEWLREIYEE